MFDPLAQMNPWFAGGGFGQSFGGGLQQPAGGGLGQSFGGWQQPSQMQGGFGFGQNVGFGPQLAPQTWSGSPFAGQSNQYGNPYVQQAMQQIPQLVHYAQQIAQQVPQLIPQIPQLIQQNPQLLQQAPQLQHIPQLLQQAALLAQQVPHVLQALCTTQQTQAGGSPFPSGGYRPFGYGAGSFA